MLLSLKQEKFMSDKFMKAWEEARQQHLEAQHQVFILSEENKELMVELAELKDNYQKLESAFKVLERTHV